MEQCARKQYNIDMKIPPEIQKHKIQYTYSAGAVAGVEVSESTEDRFPLVFACACACAGFGSGFEFELGFGFDVAGNGGMDIMLVIPGGSIPQV